MPPEIERIIGKALRKDRETRYQSVEGLAHRPAGLQEGSGVSSQACKTPPGLKRTKSRIGLDRRRRGHWRSSSDPGLLLPASRWLWPDRADVVGRGSDRWDTFCVRKSHTPPISTEPAQPGNSSLSKSQAGSRNRFPRILPGRRDHHQTRLCHALTVRPSSSVDKYRNQIIDPKKVAADLNVDTLLTGSFIKDGDDLRITTQLIDVKPDKILWREAIDLKYDKLLTVQDRVSQQIIKELELHLSPAEAANLKPEKPITSPAYEDYLRGIDFYSLNQFAAAIEMLEKVHGAGTELCACLGASGPGLYHQCIAPVRRAGRLRQGAGGL